MTAEAWRETAELKIYTGKCPEGLQIVLSYVALLKMFCQLRVRQSKAVSACILRRILKVVNSTGQLVPAVSIPSACERVSESQASYSWSASPWVWQNIPAVTTIIKSQQGCGCRTLHSVVKFGTVYNCRYGGQPTSGLGWAPG